MTNPVARTGAETGGPVEDPAAFVPAGCVMEPRTPVPADTEERDGGEALSGDHSGSSTWHAVQALAALLEPEAFNPDVQAAPEWRERTKDTALGYAAKVITSGYRLVVDDDTTVAKMVREFHEAFGIAIDQVATGPLRKLRADLVTEECEEARFALLAEDLHAIAKELADVVIVAYGSAVSLGIDLDKAVALVHASNMSKLGDDGKPVLRGDGKVLKGSNYRPPDMSAAVRALQEEQ